MGIGGDADVEGARVTLLWLPVVFFAKDKIVFHRFMEGMREFFHRLAFVADKAVDAEYLPKENPVIFTVID